jgi:hypothetical protein
MRETVCRLHDASPSIAALLKKCVGGALKSACLRAVACRGNLPLQSATTAAHPLGFMSGQHH